MAWANSTRALDKASLEWPTVPATVHSAKLDQRRTHSNSPSGSHVYSIVGSYSYEYEGEVYTSERFLSSRAYTSGFYEKEDMLRTIDLARQGGPPVMVRVNPEAPSDAFIFPSPAPPMILIVMGGAFAALGGLLLLVSVMGAIWRMASGRQMRGDT